MKKILFVLAVALFAASSCKKVYQCECRAVLNGKDWEPVITNSSIKETKKNAETACKSLEYSYDWQNYQTCKIK